MGLLLFLVIVGGLGLVWRFAAAHARPAPVWNPFVQVYEVEPVKTADELQAGLDDLQISAPVLKRRRPQTDKHRAF